MDKVLQYLEKELKRAQAIYKPLEDRLNAEDESSAELDFGEQSDMDYYMGYADGVAAGINALRLVKEGKELQLGIADME
jgi:hypothetical protein